MDHESASTPAGLATRTVLPGEPFEPPAHAQVPGPRPAPEPDLPPVPEATPQWNFGFPSNDLAQEQAAEAAARGIRPAERSAEHAAALRWR